MAETRIAKLFRNGASQAVRLPAEFSFEGKEVFVTRDDATGDLILSTCPGSAAWGHFFDLVHSIETPVDFMGERPMNVLPEESKALFNITDE